MRKECRRREEEKKRGRKMKVEIFGNHDWSELQDEINKWFEDHPAVTVRYITQSEAGGDVSWVTMSIFYKEAK